MDNDSIRRIEELFTHHIGVLSEDFQHKLGMDTRMYHLETKVDALEVKVSALEGKLDAVAIDLSAHRADTEAHHGVYRVKEG